MPWGQQLRVYTDHKNLMQDALGLTSDQVYHWRLLLEEYGPAIVYIKGIHNVVSDSISRLDYGPEKDGKSIWITFAQCWCYHNFTEEHGALTANIRESMSLVFVNQNKEDSIYPLMTREIAEVQHDDETSKTMLERKHPARWKPKVHCKDGKMVIPASLQHCVVAWFHHYLQHPGT